MISRIQIYLVVIFIQVVVIAAWTHANDVSALQSLKEEWENEPPSWVGSDPCGDNWEGITCVNYRVISIILSNKSLSGRLSEDIQGLTQLQTLSLVACSFFGTIPDSIGYLYQLVFLSLNSNSFRGQIPAAIGRLSNLYSLDLSDNILSGSIPISSGNEPGLDLLVKTKKFHFGSNKLSGGLPAKLFTANMTLIHLILENNRLNGSIPDTLELVHTLEVVRLDNNSLSGPVPANLSNLNYMNVLYLSNNRLTGPLPDLTGMDSLKYVDMSNNSFDPSDVPSWFSSIQTLTTLIMEGTHIRGEIPAAFFTLPNLQTVILRNNDLNGTINIGSSYSNQLQLIDLQRNKIDSFTERPGYTFQLILVGNPYCQEGSSEKFCNITQPPNISYSTPPDNCLPTQCSSDQISSPTCKCAYPYTGSLFFIAPSFSDLGNSDNYVMLQQSLMSSLQSYNLPIDSYSLSNPTKTSSSFLVLRLQIFPYGRDRFDRKGVSAIGLFLSNQIYKPPLQFGPFYFIGDNYEYLEVASTRSHKSSTVVIGAAVGGSVLLILLLLAGVYAFRRKKRSETTAKENDPFASWEPNSNHGGVPQLKGVKCFSFEELKKYTNNCSEINEIGAGGYGKVFKGTLPDGELVAIKRAQQGSTQGALEFKTEIELLSRVHHKYVVKLLGFCFEKGEQMLVYEYIPNGTLQDSLSGKSGIKLDWMRRLHIALGAARGFQYLHDLADPPIIHRDIKSNNILLDEHLNAKVADFGISKPLEPDRRFVTTQVKGTPGYLDPEYYMTQQLSEKSDVYSFGVLLLELITARNPFERGIYIVKEVRQTIDKSKDLYDLHSILDINLDLSMPSKSLEKFVDLAMRCLEDAGVNRPTMSDVVKEIENIMELAGLNPDAEPALIPASNEGISSEYSPLCSNEIFHTSYSRHT